MKAAILHGFGYTPRCEDSPDPEVGPDDAVIEVRAVALENVDRAIAAGTHYSSRRLYPAFPAIVGLVQIGESAGPAIQLTADALRTSGLEIYGAAHNMAADMASAYRQVVEWVRTRELTIDITTMPLS